MIKPNCPARKKISAAAPTNATRLTIAAAAAAILSAASPAGAVDLGVHNGCAATDAQFKATQLFAGPAIPSTMEGNGVLKLAFASHPDGAVDVYFVQKRGAVKRYNGRTATIDSLGLVPVDNSVGEQGLIGIALRKDFLQKPDLYLAYSSVEAGGKYSFRIARFSLSRDPARLDNATEKILIRIPREHEAWHTGGAMEFDEYGDLWGTVGDNKKTEMGPGNTADLRGGIYRIHPDDSPRGYSIPEGNFGPRMAAHFSAQGNAALSAQYLDTAKVKAEIYVKGTRNAYTLSLDPVRRWLAWGDVGPDQQKVSEEHNLVREPVFAGWPYYAGQEDVAAQGGNFYGKPVPAGSTRAAPLNQDPAALGVRNLPPIREPIFVRNQGCAMTGPIIRYDGTVKDAGQAPPQLDRKWFNSGCDGFGFHLMTLDEAGDKVVSEVKVFAQIPAVTLVDFKQGPDGNLYFVSWRNGIYRISYTGTCRDEGMRREKTGCAMAGMPNYDPAVPKAFNDPRLCGGGTAALPILRDAPWMRIGGGLLSVAAQGPHTVEVVDAGGRLRMWMEGPGPMSHDLGSLPAPGVYQVRVRTSLGVAVREVSRVGW